MVLSIYISIVPVDLVSDNDLLYTHVFVQSELIAAQKNKHFHHNCNDLDQVDD